jgi:hypothetical protein
MRLATVCLAAILFMFLAAFSSAQDIYGYDGLASVKPEISTLYLTSDGNFSMVFRNMVGSPLTVSTVELMDETTNLTCSSPTVRSVPIESTFKVIMYLCDLRPHHSRAYYGKGGLVELKYPRVRIRVDYSAIYNGSSTPYTEFGRLDAPFDDSSKVSQIWAAIVDPIWGFYNLVLLLIYVLPPAFFVSLLVWLKSPFSKRRFKILLMAAFAFVFEAYVVYTMWKMGLFIAPIR